MANNEVIAKTPRLENSEPVIFLTKSANDQNSKVKLVPLNTGAQGAYELKPANLNTGRFNIVNDYKWTTSKFKEEVPRIELVEYQITRNQQLAFLKETITNISLFDTVNSLYANATNMIGGKGVKALKDPYEGLYNGKETGLTYTFPFYNSNAVNTRTQWSSKIPPAGESLLVAGAKGAGLSLLQAFTSESTRKMVEQGATQYMPNAAAAVEDLNAPFAGIEQPMWYTGTTKNSYIVKFPLFNTVSMTDTYNNWNFVRTFTYQNLHLRSTLATYLPPVYYKCILNDYWSEIGSKPALYVSNLVIQNIGAVRAIQLQRGGKRISIPEAYMVEITLSEMITTSRNIYSSMFTGESINVQTLNQSASTPETPPSQSPGNRPPEFRQYENNLNLGPGLGLQSLPAVEPLPIPPRFESSPVGLQ